MGGFEIVGLSLACVLLAVSMIGPVIAPQVQPLLGITVDATPLILYFFIFATIYNAILLATIALQDRRKWLEAEADKHVFSIMIPSRNEENVVGRTVDSIMSANYPPEMLEVLAINDGSKDGTGRILHELSVRYPNLKVLDVAPKQAGQGKSAALNKGFEFLLTNSEFRDRNNWIIGVLDADGRVESNILRKASHRFQDIKIGAVQVLVRISNPKASVLTMLQDVEFVTFAKITQSARAVFKGAVALGGNGQFVRAEALKEIKLRKNEYWRNEALTEDLDLGTRIMLAGYENSFLSTTAIYQHGVTTLRALYKQRTRWSWGALQCFLKYIPTFEVVKQRKLSLTKKLDLIYYLSATLLPPIILLVWMLSVAALLGLFKVYTPFPTYFLIANSISFFPVIGYGLWTVRREYKAKYMVPLLFLTNAYTYHWVVCTFSAMTRVIRRKKPHWVVTQKHEMAGSPEMGLAEAVEADVSDSGQGSRKRRVTK